ncbi:MAG: type II toxin-antitoxin system YhaV family toxin [Spiribacter salinus]|uniref:Type II toxin-antitoxin system YhaV family toxin n=1 Tax=Spiribacter salinus TaxID=1335746 RepID=A0A540V8C0_9GAMM|nr:MAG: type II toxin-antitoxin system YhaV family toxin [Spiribacter salinus]
MRRHGWILLFHDGIVEQLQKLHEASDRARRKNPKGYQGNANVRLFRALTELMLEVVPSDPGRAEYRQGNTLGPAFRHWRRAKIGRRFRLFFRYDSRSRTIVFAWVNDQQTLRAVGSKSDPYAVFQKMLKRGNPPGDWKTLVEASRTDWKME